MFRLFDKEPWSLETLTLPWGNLKSIYAQICIGVTDQLPDEEVVLKPNRVRWVGGAMDGILGYHVRGVEKDQEGFAVISALERLQQRANDKSLKALYDIVTEEMVIGSIDPIMEQLKESASLKQKSRALEIGRYFATRAGHREAVKFGLALIGVFGTTLDSEILRTLGKCEEFTLFAAVALARVSDQPEQALWDLAMNVHGWGRIQIVTRLKDTQDVRIQDWMLREGFRNNVMNEYLACICARAGRLHEALDKQFVEPAVLDAAADNFRYDYGRPGGRD